MIKNCLLGFLFLLAPFIANAQIVITEIMYDLEGADADEEWIEVYNSGPVRDLRTWKFVESGVRHGINYIQGGQLGNGYIYSDEYAVIADNATQFLLSHPNFNGLLYDSSFSLSNSGEVLRIEDSTQSMINEVVYSSVQGASGDSNSLQLFEQNWLASSPTPGAAYSINDVVELVPVVTISGEINSDTTWASEEGVYYLDGKITISASTTLTILPGTIVKTKVGGTTVIEVYGTLRALGTEEQKIVVTSMLDVTAGGKTVDIEVDPAPRDWQGIYFKPGSKGELENVDIRYAGYGGGPNNIYGRFATIENDGGVVSLDDVSIRYGSIFGIRTFSGQISILNSYISDNAHGVSIEGGSVDMVGSAIGNNSDYGVYVFGDGVILNLESNSFSNNRQTALIDGRTVFTHSGNVSSDLENRGFEMFGETRDGAVWHSSDLPVIVGGGFHVPVGAALTISSGTTVKMGGSVYIQVEGSLGIEGSKGNEVRITSLKDDLAGGDTNGDDSATTATAGDWAFILFTTGSEGTINYTEFSYAGAHIYPYLDTAILNRGGSVEIQNSLFKENATSDLYQEAGNIITTNSSFLSNYSHVVVTGGDVSLSNNIFNYNANAIDNRSASTTVLAVHNWWGSSSGPRTSGNSTSTGAYILGNAIYEPWIKRDPHLPNPVIIVPGMMGSRLNDAEGEIWPNILNLAFPGEDSYLQKLKLFSDGFSAQDPGLIVAGVIKSINVPLFKRDIFEGLENKFENIGYFENQELFFFPYDWRLDISLTSDKLVGFIDELLLSTEAEKVNIIAHSMGGLVVKDFLDKNNKNSVDKFIDVATPHNGSPKAINALFSGDIDIGIANKDTMKSISQNMPTVYQLLPSRRYFDDSDASYKYYVFDGINGNRRLTFDQTKDYLKSEGRNATLVDRADEFHQEIDGLDPRDYGVETYNIVGCGTPTIGQFYVLGREGDHYNYNIKFINGDGTVPLKSAMAMPASQTYFVKNAQHAIMSSSSGVRELIISILTGESFNTSDHANIVDSEEECPIPNGKIVSFHSPIELHVYDDSGNHAGPDVNGDIENNIPGVQYETIEDNKFAFLPVGQEYQITGESTGEGTFDIRIEDVIDGEVTSTSIFADVPLSATTKTNFDIGANIPNQIYLDADGDGNYELAVVVSTTTGGFLESAGKLSSQEDRVEGLDLQETVSIGSSSGSNSRTETINEEISKIALTQVRETGSQSSVPSIASTNNKVTEKTKVISTSTANNLNNPATVYQSLGQKLKGLFRSIWRWFTSKL